MAKKTDNVTVVCYGKTYKGKREALMRKYKEGMMCCDGSERERYTSIFCGLSEGYKHVDDNWNFS